jgi:isocitrate dehydrogenase
MSNKKLVPEAKEGLNKFKMESAKEVGVNLKDGYNGDVTSKEAGSIGGSLGGAIGGNMVKKMVESYEKRL